MNQKVYVNRTLNMKKIKYIGLDMDHTLIRYHVQNFENLVYHLVIDRLIADKKYPSVLKTFQFNFSDAIRGLIIDSKNGNILKLSRFGAIRKSYHGTKEINFATQKEIYRSVYIDLKDPNYFAIDTSFSIAFCVLYSQLVDLKNAQPESLPTYNGIALDVLGIVDKVHADGSLKEHITTSIKDYVIQDKSVVDGIQQYIDYGKKFFLLTNSQYNYVDIILKYAINPFLTKGKNWQELFEFVITTASKPRFFFDDLNFLSINPSDGSMSNTFGAIKPGIYQGGNARKFTDDLKLKGDEILYIGDHIYGDILRLKKDCNWRTALVVEELGQEIASQIEAASIEKQITDAMNIKKELEQENLELHDKEIQGELKENDRSIPDLQNKIHTLDLEITKLLRAEQAFYNPSWGRVFRAGAEESYFAYQVERYACIYMEKLTDLFDQSPLTYFRAYRRLLAHDIFE